MWVNVGIVVHWNEETKVGRCSINKMTTMRNVAIAPPESGKIKLIIVDLANTIDSYSMYM